MRDTAWTIERHETLPSTNDHLKSVARQGAVDRTVVVAARQSEGRGRADHRWASPAGGLYCSLLLRDVPEPLRPLLAFAAGEALGRTLDTLQVAAPHWLKWPNDLLMAPLGATSPAGKVGGILIESVSRGEALDFAIIGVGVNLSTAPTDLPHGQEPPAVALRDLVDAVPDESLFLEVFLWQVDAVLKHFAWAPQRLVAAVEGRLAWQGEKVVVTRTDGGRVSGHLAGLTATGGLRIRNAGAEDVLDAWDVARLDRGS